MPVTVAIIVGVLLAVSALLLFRRWRPHGSVRAVEVVELRLSEQEAMRLAERTLGALDLADGPIRRRRPGTVEVTLRGARPAFGDSVEVRIQPLGAGMTSLQITSSPVVPHLWDWGRSRSIVSRVATELRAASEE